MNKDQILEAIEKMTVLELSDLVKAIKKNLMLLLMHQLWLLLLVLLLPLLKKMNLT